MDLKLHFSIITVSYNSEKYIYETIKSVLSQTYQNFEYIILDDNSTDGSWDIISSFNDARIKAIKNPENIGEYSNRNKGVTLANGEYLIFIDGDDIIYHNALETYAYYTKTFPDCAMLCAREWDFRIVYPYVAEPKTIYLFEFLGKSILGGNFTKILFKKNVIENAGYFPPNITTGDTYLQLKIALNHKILLINDGLTWWRKRKGNASDNFFKNKKHLSELINYRISFLNNTACPLNSEEIKIAKSNVYGNYLRILFRMFLKLEFKQIAYLWKRIKIPVSYYKALFIPSKHGFLKKMDGDNPLHTTTNVSVIKDTFQFVQNLPVQPIQIKQEKVSHDTFKTSSEARIFPAKLKSKKHVLLRNQWVSGWEYGVLRAFENTIVKITGAEILNYPERHIAPILINKMGHGMSKGKYRNLLPKANFEIDADVLWIVLMGPENFELDLYKGWQNSSQKKILYLCDTLPKQMNTIKKLFANNIFDVCITAFEDAIPELERITNHKWHCVMQGAPQELFVPVPFDERIIHFSSYGRRYPPFHEALLEYCKKNNLYYDYSTYAKLPSGIDVNQIYKQYAWHLTHSLFSVSWPLELTNPQNAGYLRPITTRWFEAGLSACINIGKGPDNPKFYCELTNDIVEEINPFESKENIHKQLDILWSNREALLNRNLERREQNKERWDWDHRVHQMLDLL